MFTGKQLSQNYSTTPEAPMDIFSPLALNDKLALVAPSAAQPQVTVSVRDHAAELQSKQQGSRPTTAIQKAAEPERPTSETRPSHCAMMAADLKSFGPCIDTRTGDMKVKEGIAILKKFYNQRETSFMQRSTQRNLDTLIPPSV